MELECSVPIRHPMAVCLMDSGSSCRVWYKVTLINTAMVLHWLEVSCHSVICSGKFQSSLNTSPLSTPSWYKLRTPYCHQAAIQSISPTDFFLYCLCSLSTYGHLLEFLGITCNHVLQESYGSLAGNGPSLLMSFGVLLLKCHKRVILSIAWIFVSRIKSWHLL